MSRLGVVGFQNKETMLRDWTRRKLGSVEHEVRVAGVAKLLFGLTRRWHKLGMAECNLLVFGSLVHDVGRAMGADNHERVGAEMILDNGHLRLTSTERRRLAFLTRYHRGSVPDAGEEEILDHRGGADDLITMRSLLGLLRAADSLDSRSCGTPRLVVTVSGRVLTIYGYLENGAAAAEHRLGRRKKLKLLESTLDCQVRTEWFISEQAASVG